MVRCKKITIREIADRFKVSTATISRALNHTGYVEAALKDRIIRFARKHGRPPERASGFPQGGRVQVIFNRVDNRSNSVVLQTILSSIRRVGGRCVVDVFDNCREQADLLEHPVRGARAMVVFNVSGDNSDILVKLAERGIRIITLSRHVFPGCVSVEVNHETQIRIALEHLVNLGHKNILFYGLLGNLGSLPLTPIQAMPQLPNNSCQRFVREMQNAVPKDTGDIEQPVLHCISDNFGDASAFIAALRSGAYSAVICQSQRLLAGAYNAAAGLGIRIGRDLSVVGMGHADMVDGFQPRPVMVDPNAAATGNTILEQLASPEINRNAVLLSEPRLVGGRSVCCWSNNTICEVG